MRTVLFDLDGTLTDPKLGITTCVQHALRRFGIEECFIGPPLADSFRRYYGLDERQAAQAIDYYRERFSTVGLYENAVYDGVPELLSRLRARGQTLAVATSKPTVYSQQILDHFDLSRFFDAVVGSELDGRRTDKADVIRETLRQLSLSPSEACMVGDRRQDVMGAKACGVPVIGVAYGYAEPDELEEAGADWIVDSVDALRVLLERLAV